MVLCQQHNTPACSVREFHRSQFGKTLQAVLLANDSFLAADLGEQGVATLDDFIFQF